MITALFSSASLYGQGIVATPTGVLCAAKPGRCLWQAVRPDFPLPSPNLLHDLLMPECPPFLGERVKAVQW